MIYIGMDVHKNDPSVTVMNDKGQIVGRSGFPPTAIFE